MQLEVNAAQRVHLDLAHVVDLGQAAGAKNKRFGGWFDALRCLHTTLSPSPSEGSIERLARGALGCLWCRAAPEPSPWGKRIDAAGIVVAVAALAWTFFGTRGTAPIAEAPSIAALSQLTTTSGVDFAGTISDDGDWFAFTRRAADGSYSIFLQSVGSRNSIPLVNNGVSPAFSPDGERIAFSGSAVRSANRWVGGGIFTMGRTGDDVRRLTDEGFNPAWSPDGTKVVFADEFVSWNPYTRLEVDAKLHILDIAGGTETTLDVDDGVQPSWSPNGHRIAYWAIFSGQRDIWTIPAKGGMTQADAVAVTQDPYIDYSPVWSPDGGWLYFASTRGGSMAIWRVAIDEMSGETLGEPQQITSGRLGDPGMLSFSADGIRLLYTSLPPTSIPMRSPSRRSWCRSSKARGA